MSHLLILKIVTVVVRTAAKPMINWISHYKRLELQRGDTNKFNKFMRERSYLIGQTINYYHTRVNRLLFNLPKDTIKLLPPEKAIDKGAEFISEFILYVILLGLPVLEWTRQNKENKKLEFYKEKRIRRMKNDMSHIRETNILLKKELLELNELLQKRLVEKESKRL